MKFTGKVKTGLLAGISGLLLMTSAHAQITQYDTRDDFDAAFPTPDIVENWDDNAVGTIIPAGISLDEITYQTNISNLRVVNTSAATTSFNALGNEESDVFTESDYVTFEFDIELYAFAIDIIDLSSFSLEPEALFQATTSAGDVIISKSDPFGNFNSVDFHSINFSSETPFNSIKLENTNNVLFSIWLVDTLRGITAPPTAPGSLGLLPLLVIVLLGLRKQFNQRC